MLKSLDLYLATCSKTEAAKIDAITYSRITDMAAMYRILVALRMHRPTPSLHYSSITECIKWRDAPKWRLWPVEKDILRIMEDPRQFRSWKALSKLENFRMPTGKRDEDWIKRADSAVSFHPCFMARSCHGRSTEADNNILIREKPSRRSGPWQERTIERCTEISTSAQPTWRMSFDSYPIMTRQML